jgi:hypothetical protein
VSHCRVSYILILSKTNIGPPTVGDKDSPECGVGGVASDRKPDSIKGAFGSALSSSMLLIMSSSRATLSRRFLR